MKYYIQTLVWIRDKGEGNSKLEELGIDVPEGTLEKEKLMLDIFSIKYFYPCTMVEDGDSCYVMLDGDNEIIIAQPWAEFVKEFYAGIKEMEPG